MIAFATGSLCAFATLTIWLEVSYAERCFEAAILLLAAVAGWRGTGVVAGALTVVALWGPFQLITGASVVPYETSYASLRWAALLATF